MQLHPDRPKLINLLIEFQQKLESNLKQKKYREFLKSTLKLQTLSQNIPRDKPIITKQLIAFKLGLQSKLPKCVQITLTYLNRLFEGKFIDINLDDYSQHYIIGKDEIKEQEIEPTRQIRDMLIKTLEELVHFKNQAIDNLLIVSFEHLITEDVLTPILMLSERSSPAYVNLLTSFFSFRFYYFEDTCLYTETEADYINAYAPKMERLCEQIKKAQVRHNQYQNHIGMYLEELVGKASGEGGKHGLCVVCKGESNTYCKDTKASVCSPACKEQHLNKVIEVEGAKIQSEYIFESIIDSLNELFEYIKSQSKSILIMIELIEVILSRPYLFMVVKNQISTIFYRELPFIIGCLYPQKNTRCQNLLFSIMASITHLYKHLFLSDIQQFFQLKIISELQLKKPRLDSLLSINKFVNNIFKNGQNFIELYLNLDMALNRDNIVEKLMYELGRILQDRFGAGTSDYSKGDKISLKRESLNMHIGLIRAILNVPYPKEYAVDTESLINAKNKKTSIEKFILKFNDNTTAGVKSLFNLNLITLDNQEQETLSILQTTKGIKKSSIEQYLLQPNNQNILLSYIKQLHLYKRTLVEILLDYYRLLPVPDNITYQKDSNDTSNIFVKEYERITGNHVWDQMIRWTKIFKTSDKLSYEKFKESLEYEQLHFDDRKIYELFIKVRSLSVPTTQTYELKRFSFCHSRKYLELIQGQVNLLQISISHLLESQYDIISTLEFARLLQELCPSSSNIFILIIKNTNFQYISSIDLTEENLLCINYLIEVPEEIPNKIFDWTPLLKFYNQMFYFTLGACLTPVTIENKNKLLGSNLSNVSINILKIASQLTEENFQKFIISMFKLAINEMKHERTFLLQKAWNIVNTEVELFVRNWGTVFAIIRLVVLEPVHYQIFMFCLNSLKQNFVLVKMELKPQQETAYFELLREFFEKFPALHEVLLQTICSLVETSSELNSKSWKVVLELSAVYVENEEKNYHRVYEIIEKIMASELIFFLPFFPQIFNLLKSICNNNSKLSSRVFIDFQVLLQFLSKKVHKKLDTTQDKINSQSCSELLEKLLPSTLEWLTNKFDSQSFDTSIQVFFALFKLQITELHISNKKQNYEEIQNRTVEFLDIAFAKIIQRTKSHPSFFINAESFINEAVSVGAKMKYFYILKCLSRTIYQNFNEISFLSVKGIKTFIQILNPQTSSEWSNITGVLLQIMQHSRTKNIAAIESIKKQVSPLNIYSLIKESKLPPSFPQLSNISTIMNKILIQKQVLELLPNDPECLPLLKDIYAQLRIINDNIPLRICLWKSGFGKGSTEIPSLLILEDTVVSRILSIYSFHKFGDEYYLFASQTFMRYSMVSQEILRVEGLIESPDTTKFQYEMYVLLENDYKRKRHLNEKFVRYLLPKLTEGELVGRKGEKVEGKEEVKRKLGESIVGLIGLFDAKTLLIKILRNFV